MQQWQNQRQQQEHQQQEKEQKKRRKHGTSDDGRHKGKYMKKQRRRAKQVENVERCHGSVPNKERWYSKKHRSQSSMKQQPARAQFCCSLPSFSSYISPTSLVESEKISMAASSLWAHWVGQICPCTSRKIEATNADALGRSWRTSRPKQLPVYQKKNYMEIGRPIPASSWSRVLQFAGRDKTFVHVITPMFHADGDVSMMMCRKRALVGWREQCTLHETIIVRV